MRNLEEFINEKLKVSKSNHADNSNTYEVVLEEYLSWYFNLVSFYNQVKDKCPIIGTWDYLIPSVFKNEKEVIDFLKEHDDDIVTIYEYDGQNGITWINYSIDGIDFEDSIEKGEKYPDHLKA